MTNEQNSRVPGKTEDIIVPGNESMPPPGSKKSSPPLLSEPYNSIDVAGKSGPCEQRYRYPSDHSTLDVFSREPCRQIAERRK